LMTWKSSFTLKNHIESCWWIIDLRVCNCRVCKYDSHWLSYFCQATNSHEAYFNKRAHDQECQI